MAKSIVISFFLLLSSVVSHSQTDTLFLKKQIHDLTSEIQSIKKSNTSLSKKLEDVNNTLSLRCDSLENRVSENTSNIQVTADKLGIKIDQSTNSATKKINDLDNSISKSSLYWIIGFLITALLFVIIYFLLRRKIRDGNSALDKQISATKRSLEEEGIKLDTKLTEILETQLKLLNVERMTNTLHSEEPDHSLALKVADEIVRIQKNLTNMDANTKGLKQLAASVNRIQDNFEANGYEVAELLNKPYDPKMKVIVTSSIPDENLKSGEEIITRIIKPQVNFKGVMIQSAQVEVSVGQ